MNLQVLEDARIEQGISKKVLCDALKINCHHYNKIIGNAAGNVTTVFKIAKYLGINSIPVT